MHGLEGCGIPTERLYIDNISAVNRFLATLNSECQVRADCVLTRVAILYSLCGKRFLFVPVPPAFEESAPLKPRVTRTPRRPVVRQSQSHRVPPGQVVASRWPVLHRGAIPLFDPKSWDFRVWGLVEVSRSWTWTEFQNLPTAAVEGDLHCVTRWSSLDHTWTGVTARTIVDLVGIQPSAGFVLLHGEAGYTANVPIDVFFRDNVVLATHHEGQPLTPEHGAPLRIVIPDRYAWKSVKWLRGLEFLEQDRPGFWEAFGYSNAADPWREERFATEEP